MKLNLTVDIDGEVDDLINKVQDVVIGLQEGYRSGIGWDTKQVD